MFTRADRLMLNSIYRFLVTQLTKGAYMPVDLSGLTQAVANEVTVDDGVLTLITGLVAQIKAAASNQVDAQTQINLNTLVNTLQNEKARLAAAVIANTPTATATTPAATEEATTAE